MMKWVVREGIVREALLVKTKPWVSKMGWVVVGKVHSGLTDSDLEIHLP